MGSVKKPKETLLTIEDFQKIRTAFNLSYKVTSGIATAIRIATKNSKIIEPNLKRKLLNQNHKLDDLFDCKDFDFKRVINKDISVSSETLICCNTLHKLIEHITESRNIKSNHLKFGIDGGGGFLKVCLSIQSTMENFSNENIKQSTRQSFKDGIASKKLKNSSVRKLLVLGLAPCVQENYENGKQLWSELGINDFKGTIAIDLKLANILVGVMAHSSLHPCCWCYANKNNLQQVDEYRTVGNGLKNYMEWREAGGNKNNANNYAKT